MLTKERGVYVLREGQRRLLWRHQMEPGALPPLHSKDWVVGSLWPSRKDKRELRERISHGARMLVIADMAPAEIELPEEHVPYIPRGVMVTEHSDGLVTLRLPELEWLPKSDADRGAQFLKLARGDSNDQKGSPISGGALILEHLSPNDCLNVRFAVLKNNATLKPADLAAALTDIFGSAVTPTAHVRAPVSKRRHKLLTLPRLHIRPRTHLRQQVNLGLIDV